MSIVQNGTTYNIYDSSVNIHNQLPPAIYKVRFSQQSGYSLVYSASNYILSERVYGVHKKKVDKVLNAFKKFNRSEGVILSGDKGIGKSLFTKMLSNAALALGYPVVLVEEPTPRLGDFLDSITTECVILFDEFDKTFYDPYGKSKVQNSLLSLFDGTSYNKKLFIITCNNLKGLSEFLLNRPGRFHYHIRFKYPTPAAIQEYMENALDEKYYSEIEDVIKLSLCTKVNYDVLRAIAYELNQGYSFEDAIEDLNIDKGDTLSLFKISYKQKNDCSNWEQFTWAPRTKELPKLLKFPLITNAIGHHQIGHFSFMDSDIQYDANNDIFFVPSEKINYNFDECLKLSENKTYTYTDEDKENAKLENLIIDKMKIED